MLADTSSCYVHSVGYRVKVSEDICWCAQLEEMRELSFRNVDVSDKAQAELKNARKRIDELNAEMTRLISQVTLVWCRCIGLWV